MTTDAIHLTRTGVQIADRARVIKRLKEKFDRSHCLLLKNFLDPSLLKQIALEIKTGVFYERVHKGISLESCLRPSAVTHILDFAINDSALFQVIREISGCAPVGCFNGRVYRMRPGKGHYDSWHSDINEKQQRMVGMSINLSPKPYQGGVLQIRDDRSKKILKELHNTGFGDAILFRLKPYLEHQVTNVDGPFDKTAYAGWFQQFPKNKLISKKGNARPVTRGDKSLRINRTFRVSKKVMTRQQGTAFLICQPSRDVCYGLDGVGRSIWDHLQQSSTVSSLTAKLSSQYNAPPETLKKDAERMIRVLFAQGFIE